MGKGSKPRPFTNRKTFDENWDAIFGKKPVVNQSDTSTPKEEDDYASRQTDIVQPRDIRQG